MGDVFERWNKGSLNGLVLNGMEGMVRTGRMEERMEGMDEWIDRIDLTIDSGNARHSSAVLAQHWRITTATAAKHYQRTCSKVSVTFRPSYL